MNKSILALIFLIISCSAFSQSSVGKKVEALNEEGVLLYHLEKTSWLATDLLTTYYPYKVTDIGGYFSYPVDENFVCVFFNNDDPSKASLTISFDSSFSFESAVIDTSLRLLRKYELEIGKIRQGALDEIINGNKINQYSNTDLNIIPLIKDGERKVYILTATTENGVLILGNDYLLKFNKKNKLKEVEPLHKGILKFEEKDSISWSSHSHLPEYNPFMTPTDVCSLLLYGEYSDSWHHHTVISKEYVSIWDYDVKSFMIMKSKVFFKSYKEED